MRRTVQVLVPLILLGILLVLTTEWLFEHVPTATTTTIIFAIGILLFWR